MSYPKNRSNFLCDASDVTRAAFGEMVGAALRAQYGTGWKAAKRLANATGASAESADNWLAGNNPPGGVYLVRCIAACDGVLEIVLSLTGRRDILDALYRADAVQDLKRAVEKMEALR